MKACLKSKPGPVSTKDALLGFEEPNGIETFILYFVLAEKNEIFNFFHIHFVVQSFSARFSEI